MKFNFLILSITHLEGCVLSHGRSASGVYSSGENFPVPPKEAWPLLIFENFWTLPWKRCIVQSSISVLPHTIPFHFH